MAPPSSRRILGIAAGLALVLLLAGQQITAHGWYSANPAYRAQVDSFLHGRFAISVAPEMLRHDYAWTDSGVQQVWGLGVPIWQTPFELAARVVGAGPFPDRVALFVWIALAFYIVIGALVRDRKWWVAAVGILVTALLPAFVTLIRGRVGVYEEAAIYAYAAAMMLLGGVLRLVATPARWRYFLLAAGAGLVGFIRPTTWCYGLATIVVASIFWWQHRGRRGLVEIAVAGLLFTAGGGALYATNARRFGDGFEFGHKLNLQSFPGNLYATRFSYPMQRASIGEATLELVGGLFDRPELRARGGFYQKNLHHGVSKHPRWREYYFTTFSWWYVPFLLAGLWFGVRRRKGDRNGLAAWAVVAAVPLVAFYLRGPFLASRYYMDLAPALAALLLITWLVVADRVGEARARIAAILVALAWLVLVITAKTAQPRSADPVDRSTALRDSRAFTDAVPSWRVLPAAYDLNDPRLPIYTDLLEHFDRCAGTLCVHGDRAHDSEQWEVRETAGDVVRRYEPAPALYLNAYRWNLETGAMPPATYAFVQNARFIEIDADTTAAHVDWSREVRVRVGLTALHLVSTTPTARGTRLRFEAEGIPQGLQVAFFAFGPDDDLAKPVSRVSVYRIAWQ
jgi:hypothetical protein